MTMKGFPGIDDYLPVNVDKYIDLAIQTDYWEPEVVYVEVIKSRSPSPSVKSENEQEQMSDHMSIESPVKIEDSKFNLEENDSESEHVRLQPKGEFTSKKTLLQKKQTFNAKTSNKALTKKVTKFAPT